MTAQATTVARATAWCVMYQSGEINDSVKYYLTDKKCKPSRFFLLPKIHKGINPPPGRPVVASNVAPTEKISKFVDYFFFLIQPLKKSNRLLRTLHIFCP